MIIAVQKTARALDGQIEIFDPLSGRAENTAAGFEGQNEIGLMHPQAGAVGFQLRVDLRGRSLAVMVAVVDHQTDTQREGAQRRIKAGQKAPSDVGRVRIGFEPDPRLDTHESDGKEPDRNAAVEMKRFDVDVTRRADRAAAPAIGEERPALLAVDELGIGLRPQKPAAQRRLDRRDQQTVIAPGQASGDRTRRIGAEAVGEPPFPPLGLLQIAADGAAKVDQVRDGGTGQCVKPRPAPPTRLSLCIIGQ